ncbi:ABC transporter permease [Pseudoalteromonas ardens]|uniref:ABC3 transporter permease C-terminal domain-containing protein n=1 Tax=Pseudoalteromonas rubra TaxID=43658 RepID=A0A0L0EVB3_9GAMM|nr:FtsX-like permease family protein [Pseudoalteromonas sp. R96]KNC68315.1 hypothetical protein AC626_05715 [Pseudoalteromonas rubra]MDK1309668.1 FtsX-like permease family protein [Pseudoalteromonas sp. R96]
MSIEQAATSYLARQQQVAPGYAVCAFALVLWRQVLQGKYWLTLGALSILFFYLLLSSLLGQGVERFLAYNLQATLGADTQVTVRRTWQEPELTWIRAHSDSHSLQSQYRVTLSHQSHHQPVLLKAVDSNYPLQGDIHISLSKALNTQRVQQGPSRGEVWLEPRLAVALAAELGDTIMLGGTQLRVSALLQLEPDRILEGFGSDMRAMVSDASLRPEQLTPHFSRALMLHTRLSEEEITRFQSSSPTAQIVSKSLNNYPLAKVWERVQNFLGLLSLIIVLLSVLILWLCSQVQIQPLKKSVSVLLACGMSRRMLPVLAIIAGAMILMLSLLPALILSLLASHGVSHIAQVYIDGFSLQWQWQDLLAACALATVVYVFIALPVWLSLLQGDIRLLLEQRTEPKRWRWLAMLSPVGLLAALVVNYTDNWLLSGMLLSGLGVCVLLVLFVTWLVLRFGGYLLPSSWVLSKFSLLLLRKRMSVKLVQITALGLSVTLLLLCFNMGRDVTSMLSLYLYQNQGNVFVSRADDEQKAALESFVGRYQGHIKEMKPFQLAQVTHINGIAILARDVQPSDTLRRLEQPVNLHWRAQAPENVQITQGTWTDAFAQTGVSVDQEVFEDLALSMGDRVQLVVGSESVEASVTAVHRYKPGGSSVTFWFVLQQSRPPSAAEPIYHMGGVELNAQGVAAIGALWRAHPQLRLVTVDALLEKIRAQVQALITLVLSYAAFIVLLSNLLMVAAIQTHMEKDQIRNGLLLSFGLSPTQGLKILLFEWLMVTLIPALCAVGAIYSFIDAFYQQNLAMPYQGSLIMMLAEALAIALVVAVSGILLSRKQLRSSAMELLNEGG